MDPNAALRIFRVWVLWTDRSEVLADVRATNAADACVRATRTGAVSGLGARRDYLGLHATAMAAPTLLAIDAAADAARRELATALVRYERLAGEPRWLACPLVGDIAAVARAARIARARGAVARAVEIEGYLADDARRIARRAALRRTGRSATAWRACAARLDAALARCLAYGVALGDPEGVAARARDAWCHAAASRAPDR